MEELQDPFFLPDHPERVPSHATRYEASRSGNSHSQEFGFSSVKKRGHGTRSWIQIDHNGNSRVLELDKATLMKHCSLPARDLRLLDPMFIYPSTILGREKAIVVNLEQIRCIITSNEVILMNSLDNSVMQYESELCKRLQMIKGQSDDLPFEFRALELALELTCMLLDGQVQELEMEIHPVLDELASSISTLNLERVRRFKGHLLALTRRVQKVRDEIEQLMEDDGDMAELYLTEKKERAEAYSSSNQYFQYMSSGYGVISKSEPVSPMSSIKGSQKLDRTFSSMLASSKQGSSTSLSRSGYNIEKLEMLLEAYFVVIDNTFSKLLSLKEYIDDTEDLINIKLVRIDREAWGRLGNVQNQLILFELLLTAATFFATIFAVVTGIFGMNFQPAMFGYSSAFDWVLIITGVGCGISYLCFLQYLRRKKILSL